ncbi:MAG: NADH-quinone oxidoreductase subunit L [Firmicutes bacterium]|jgi:multicomponent Na+:H+ antiporter subunit D|nr:NADH-quinone oxidoreductase subunit L [Bacillota bacterium]
MQVIESSTVLIFAVPLVIFLINSLFSKRLAEKFSMGLAYVAPITQIVATAACFVQIAHLKQHDIIISWDLAGAVSMRFAVHTYSLVFLFCIALVSLASIMVANRTVPQKRTGFASLLMMLILGMNGIVMVTDLFSLYVFLEIVGISSFVLIAMFKSETGLEGAFKYLVMSVLASIMILTGLAFIFMQTGSLQYDHLEASALAGQSPTQLVLIYAAMILMIAGFAIKTGAVPFHSWLPDAHQSANTAVSVLLSGIVIKVAGIYGLIVITGFFGKLPGIKLTLFIMGTISIIIGALFALRQSHFKRIVAYSSVSQMGYILLGLSTVSMLGLLGAVAHVFNHATFKSTLFTNAAAVHEQTGTYDINELGGLEKKMGVTSFSSLAAFMSTAGIPPFAGFWSKLLIIMALWSSGARVFAAIALFASIFTAAYFLRLQRKVFFGKLRDQLAGITEIGGSVKLAQIMLTVVTIAAGLLFPFALLYFRGIGLL